MKRRIATLLTLALLASPLLAGSQLFPSKRDNEKLSAYLISPLAGVDSLPKGWAKKTGANFGNCAIADVSLVAERNVKETAPVTTTSYALPKSDYTVSICIRGKGKARIAGKDAWKEFDIKPANYFKWVELGDVKGAEKVAVEVVGNGNLCYGGMLAEGDILPIIPVKKVWEKIQAGGPVTVALVGDSVTENAYGKGGGSSSFDKGNPGLMKAFLEKSSGQDVDYIAHREPKNWPKFGPTRPRLRNPDPAAWPELEKLPVTKIGKTQYPDARQPLDKTKKVHLINLGKGGADSTYTWSRMPETIIENDYRFSAKANAAKGLSGNTVRYGLGYYKPDLVIINFGTNDNNGAHPKWTVDDYIFYTRCAATNIQQRLGSAVILATPHKWNRGVHLKHHWEPELVDRLRDYCKKSGFALADIVMEYKLGEGDGIHPGNAGHQHMADAYIKAIKGEKPVPASKPTITKDDMKDNGDGTISCEKLGLMMIGAPSTLGEVKSQAEAAALVKKLNEEKKFGHADWRLPKRSELFGMIDYTQRPAVVAGAPFKNLMGFYYIDTEGKGWGMDFTVGQSHTLGGRGNPKTGGVFPVRDLK